MEQQVKAGQVVRIHEFAVDPTHRTKAKTGYVEQVEDGYAWVRIAGRHAVERPVWMLRVVR